MDLREASPHTVKIMAYRAVEDKLLRDLAAKSPGFQAYGKDVLPWLAPINSALDDKMNPDWNELHATMARTRAADGMWNAAKISGMLARKGVDYDANCVVCGVTCDQTHIDWVCCTSDAFKHQYCDGRLALIFRDAANRHYGSLTSTTLAPDLSRCLPPPCTSSRTYWVIPPPTGYQGFGRSAFGDGSTKAIFGPRSARSAYAVVQLRGWGNKLSVRMCMVGTVPLPYLDTPAAELCAFIAYLENIDDKNFNERIEFLSDCQWVIDAFLDGEAYTTRASMACAELWKRLWRARRAIRAEVIATKVAARVSDGDVRKGYPIRWKDGNSCADAAAKGAFALHP